MAEAAVMPQVLIAFTDANWTEDPFQFYLGGSTTADNFAGATAKMGLRLGGASTSAVELTTANGYLTIIAPNQISITAPLALMSTILPGLYNWEIVVTYASGDIEAVLVGQVRIVQGLT